MIKSLHSAYTATQASVDTLRISFDEVKINHNLEFKRALRPIVERKDKIEKKQDEMSGKLIEIQTSMEILLSIMLDDDKKGEIIAKSKCTPSVKDSKIDDDDAADGGNKGGKTFRSHKAEIGSCGV